MKKRVFSPAAPLRGGRGGRAPKIPATSDFDHPFSIDFCGGPAPPKNRRVLLTFQTAFNRPRVFFSFRGVRALRNLLQNACDPLCFC